MAGELNGVANNPGAAGAAPAAAPAPSPPVTPAPPPSTPSPGSSGVSAPAPGSSGVAGLGQQQTPPAATAPEWVGVRDALRNNYGIDLGQGAADDNAALQVLAQRYREAQELAPHRQVLEQYRQHGEQFNAWLRQQEAAKAQQTQKKWWEAPEFDPRWESQIVRDPVTQELRPAQGAPADVVQRYLKAVNHQRDFLNKFSFDPLGAIQPGVEEVARKIANEIVQQHLGSFQERTFADQFVQQNAGWLYRQGADGRPARDPLSGQPQLSEWGGKFKGYCEEAAQLGLATSQQQQAYALKLVRADAALAQQSAAGQQQTAQQQGDAQKQQFLQAAANGRGAAAPAAVTPPGAPAVPAPSQGPLQRSLQERMLQAMAQNGFQPGQELVTSR